MARTAVDALAAEGTAYIGEKVADAYREAIHLAGEARALKNRVRDTAEDSVRTVRRSVTHGIERAQDLRDATVHRVKRHPLASIGVAIGAGMVLGAAVSWISRRRG